MKQKNKKCNYDDKSFINFETISPTALYPTHQSKLCVVIMEYKVAVSISISRTKEQAQVIKV